MKNSRIFPWIVAFAAFAVSGSAAYYSVFGIGRMFAGASVNAMIMASSLEFSKLVIASLLYSYWTELNKLLRAYLSAACFILVLITSAGIYGFLSSAYQETANKVEVSDKKNGSLEKQKSIIQSDIKRYESQIELKDSRINSLSEIKSRQQGTMDNLIAKNSSIKSIKSQMGSIDDEISKLDGEVKILNDSLNSKNDKIKTLDLQALALETDQDLAKEIGPLKYISKLTHKSLDEVVNYFIIALMLVFDPLAISLVISANFLFSSLNVKKTAVSQSQDDDKKEDKKDSKKNEVIKEKPEEEVDEESDMEDEDSYDESLWNKELDIDFNADYNKDIEGVDALFNSFHKMDNKYMDPIVNEIPVEESDSSEIIKEHNDVPVVIQRRGITSSPVLPYIEPHREPTNLL